jgi:hypothetical protein
MISFHQFINLKEALSLDDPLAQSTLKIKDKNNTTISFEFTLDNNNYKIIIYSTPKIISIQYEQREIILDRFKLMYISLKANQSHSLTNQSGMQANTVYNMLLNAIKQSNDHFGENNINGYTFSGVETAQDLMYDRLMKRFAPNLITWSIDDGIYLKPEAVQKLKDQNPDLIEEINDHIHQETSEREMQIQQDKQNKARERSRRRQQP